MTFKEVYRRNVLLQFVLNFTIWFLVGLAVMNDDESLKRLLLGAFFYGFMLTLVNHLIYRPKIPLYFKKENFEDICRMVEEMGYSLKKEKKGNKHYRKGTFLTGFGKGFILRQTPFYGRIDVPPLLEKEVMNKIVLEKWSLY